MAVIFFTRIQEERLNHEVRRTRVTPRPAMPRPTTPSTAIQAPAPKKLTRDELHERSTKGLYWHCDESWSREHRCKKGQLLMIEPVENKDNEPSKKAHEPKEEAMEEESDYTVHALAGYSNPQTMKVGGLLQQQRIIVLIDTGNTNNFLNSKSQLSCPLFLLRQVDYKRGKGVILLRLILPMEIVYPYIPDPDGEDEGGQASSSLMVSIRWISTGDNCPSWPVVALPRGGHPCGRPCPRVAAPCRLLPLGVVAPCRGPGHGQPPLHADNMHVAAPPPQAAPTFAANRYNKRV
ncbi:hypothetical protein B296_00044780 [Ensete ventricosum]|uniref:Uncharacterized protein n=1 Tax=Ensete ventricosum TaxID=4639 RepID=A0A426WWQ7_ENSVE|nr:hypothetical protein B296_00044780 [Ensete ventricosum]